MSVIFKMLLMCALQEIDALDNDGSNDIDGVPLAETDAKAETLPPSVPLPPENSEAHSETESEEQEEEQEEELVQPVGEEPLDYCL